MATTKLVRTSKIVVASLTFVLLVLTIFNQCQNSYYYEANIEIPEYGWDNKKAATFETDIRDSLQNFNIIFKLGNTNEYRFSNIWFFVKTTAPSGASHKDTLEYIISKKSGEWLGKISSGTWISKMYFKNAIRFPEVGKYKFEIWQGMRTDTLKGITQMGIIFEDI